LVQQNAGPVLPTRAPLLLLFLITGDTWRKHSCLPLDIRVEIFLARRPPFKLLPGKTDSDRETDFGIALQTLHLGSTEAPRSPGRDEQWN